MKYAVLVIVMIMVVLIGCKKSSNNPVAMPSIVGKWYETKGVLRQTLDGLTYTTYTNIITNKSTYIIFNSDGTGTETDTTKTSPFTYKLTGSQLAMSPDDDNNSTYTIESLTTASFTLHDVFSFRDGNNTVSGTLDLYLSR